MFFFPDMDIGGTHLVSLLRPGGRFTAATWDSTAIKPVPAILMDAIRDVGGEVPSDESDGPRPTERVNTPEALAGRLSGLGLRDVEVTEFPHRMPFGQDTAWALVMGLPPETVDRVRARFTMLLAERGADTFNATTLIGTGRAPE